MSIKNFILCKYWKKSQWFRWKIKERPIRFE